MAVPAGIERWEKEGLRDLALLEVANLRTYIYTRRDIHRAVDGVSFYLDHGRRLGLIGESGSGVMRIRRDICYFPASMVDTTLRTASRHGFSTASRPSRRETLRLTQVASTPTISAMLLTDSSAKLLPT